jgi:hypothetical protein
MPAPEPDLDAILPLLDPESWVGMRPSRAPRWLMDRDAAAVALCWLVGVRPRQLRESLLRRDWRPGPGELVDVRVGGRYVVSRTRALPVLEAARDAVGRYLGSCPVEFKPDGPLLLHADGSWYVLSDEKYAARRIARITAGRVLSLADLSDRYRRYVEWTRATDGTVERLAGRTGPFDGLDPSSKALARALRAAHPFGRGALPAPGSLD